MKVYIVEGRNEYEDPEVLGGLRRRGIGKALTTLSLLQNGRSSNE